MVLVAQSAYTSQYTKRQHRKSSRKSVNYQPNHMFRQGHQLGKMEATNNKMIAQQKHADRAPTDDVLVTRELL